MRNSVEALKFYGMSDKPPEQPAPDDFGVRLGKAISAARQKAGFSVNAFAKRLGVSRWQTVQFWELGKSAPNAANLKAIAEVTGVSVDEMLEVALGGDPPFEGWRAFLDTEEGKRMDEPTRRALRAFLWPPGKTPDVADYLMILRVTQANRQ